MSHRFWPVLSVLLVVLLAVAACTSPSAAPPPAAPPTAAPQPTKAAAPAAKERVTLTWAFWGSPEEADSHKLVAEPRKFGPV